MVKSSSSTFDWPLICPDCGKLLAKSSKSYLCRGCGRVYNIIDDVVQFVPEDPFYENRYAPQPLHFLPNKNTLWGRALLYLVSMHYFWYIQKYIPRGSRILDVAGGAGSYYLANHGQMAGLEVSMSSAREMAKIYDLTLQASALRIPLANSSVDAIVSRFFLEHVPQNDKARLLAEFHRVLKPGGWLITLQDCDSNNFLWRWAKKDSKLFRERFIENDGHYGLMYASENLALFKEADFEILRYYASNKTPFVSLSMIQWMQPYRNKSFLASVLLALGSVLARNKWLNHAYTFAMTLVDDIMEPFLPLDHARYLLAVCRAI